MRFLRVMANEENHGAEQTTAPRNRSIGSRLKWPLIALVVIAALYLVSPYYSFWRFTEALKAGDQQRFEKMVDFRSVRESLKKQLKAKMAEGKPAKDANEPKRENPLFALSEQFAPRLIDTLVDAYVTPAGLAALLADAKNVDAARAAGGNPSAASADAVAQSQEVRDKLGFKSVRYAFFTGARDFMIDVDGTKLRFRFSKFRWTLKTVEPELSELRL